MAERRRPLKLSGGNVTGTRRMVLSTPERSRIFQNGSLLRRISTDGRSRGISNFPIRRTRCAERTLAEESAGAYVRRSRLRKSKILCLAGFTPVAKVDQATGDSGGQGGRRRRYDPCRFNRARFGILPSAIHFSVSSGSSPSRPRKISFFTRAARMPRFLRGIMRKGHSSRDATLARKESESVRNEPR